MSVSMQSQQDKGEAEEVVCRICRLEADTDNVLFHPCKCSGTIKFVHQDCLNQWLKHSGHTHCEVCKHKFSFTPLYAPDAPPNLPWLELAWGLGQKSAGAMRVGLRVLLVLFVWLSVVPLSTCWLWRLGFTRSLSEAVSTLKSRIHPVLVFADCVQGSLISSVLIFLVLFVGYVWDQVRVYWALRQAEQLQQEQPLQQPEPQAPQPLRLVDQLRQQQQQREQHPQAQTGLASTPAARLAAEQVAHRRHDARPEQARLSSSQRAPQLPDVATLHKPEREAEQASSSQQATQQPDVAALHCPEREVAQPGSAANEAAVLPTVPAELPAAAAAQGGGADRQGGRADSQGGRPDRALTGGRQQPPLEGAAPVTDAMSPPVTAQQAAPTAKPSPSLHSSAASLSAEAPTMEQCAGPGAPAVVPDVQSPDAAMQVAAPVQQQTSSLHQATNESAQEAHPMPQHQADLPKQSGVDRQQRGGVLPQQQADLPKHLGVSRQQQWGVSPQQQAVTPELLEGGPMQTGVHEHPDAAPPETESAAAAAAAAVAPEQQAVRQLQEPAVMRPQPALVPLVQPPVPVEQPLVLAPQQGQAAAGLNDEPMAFEELVGLRGPIRLLFENAGTVIFSSAVFMATALWAPFMWGRITIRGIATAQTAWKLTVLPAAAMQLLLKNYQASAGMQSTLLPSQGGTEANYTNSSLMGQGQLTGTSTAGAPDNMTAHVITLERLAHDLQQHLAGPDLSDWLCLAVGYLSLACVAFTAAWLMVSWKVLWQHWRPRLLTQHSLLHLTHRLLQDVWTKLSNSAGLVAVMAKVMAVLVTELLVLPVAYGFWLDVCALPLFEGSLEQRLALLRSAPLTWTLLHWALGMACLMITAAFLSVVRGVLRPGALPWLKDPFDPEGEPLQQVLDSNVFLQLQREILSLASMSCLAVLLVHLPIKLATAVAPSLFPFSFHPLDTVTEVPADMLLLHVCLPFTLPHLHVRQWSKAALSWWLRTVSRPLNVEHYLLPPRPPHQPGPGAHPQQLPAPPAPADPVAALPQNSAATEAPQQAASTRNEVPALPEEAVLPQHMAASSQSSSFIGSQEASQAAAARHDYSHDQQRPGGSGDVEGMMANISGRPAPDQPDQLDSGSSAQPQQLQPSTTIHADLASAPGQGSWLPRSALQGGNELGDWHSDESRHGSSLESTEGEEGEVGDSQQGAQPSGACGHNGDHPSGPSSSWECFQADDGRPQSSSHSVAQAGPSTQTGTQAGTHHKGDLPGSAARLSDALPRTAAAGPQSGVASQAGQLPSPGAQAAPVEGTCEASATAEGLVANTQLDDSNDLTSQLLTVGLLLMLTLLLFMTGLLTLPCIIGRALLRTLHAPLRHDLYCAVLGAYAIWASVAAAARLHGLVQHTQGGRSMMTELQGWLITSARLGLLAFLTLIVIPFMAGLYLDLVMLPFRVRGSESPVIFIYQDWACGVLLTKICYKIVTSEGTLPRSLTRVRDRVQLIQRLGVLQVPFMLAFQELLWPILKPMSLLLALPYAITRGIVPLLDMSPAKMQALHIYGFAFEYVMVLMYYSLQHLRAVLRHLHNSIRDDHYLVGRQLNNFLNSHI